MTRPDGPVGAVGTASTGTRSAGLARGLGVDRDGGVGECGSEVVGGDFVGDAGGAVGAGVAADGEFTGRDDGVALGQAVEGVFCGFAEDGDPVVGGGSVDPFALVVAGPVGDGDVEVGVGLAGVFAVAAVGVAGEVAFDDDVTGHAALLGVWDLGGPDVVVICDPLVLSAARSRSGRWTRGGD